MIQNADSWSSFNCSPWRIFKLWTGGMRLKRALQHEHPLLPLVTLRKPSMSFGHSAANGFAGVNYTFDIFICHAMPEKRWKSYWAWSRIWRKLHWHAAKEKVYPNSQAISKQLQQVFFIAGTFKLNGVPSNARFKKLSSSCGVKNHSIHDLPGNRDRPPFGVLSRRSWERPDAMRTNSWIPSTWSMNLRESWLLLVILLCFASVKFWFVFRPVRWHHHPNVVGSHLSNLHGWNGLKNSTSDRSNSHRVHRLPPGCPERRQHILASSRNLVSMAAGSKNL